VKNRHGTYSIPVPPTRKISTALNWSQAIKLIRTSELVTEQLQFTASQLVAEFGYLYPDWDLSTATAELSQDPGEGLPLHVVAVADGQVLGIASIISDDEVAGWEAKEWWLANVFVLPERRHVGIGIALVNHAVNISRDSGADDLHLVTDTAEPWYRKQGWGSVGIGLVHGHQMTVMRIDLKNR
jgi:predicted N-acetyltransferase YhbS